MIDYQEQYRFYFSIDDGPRRRVKPLWGNSHSRDRKRESDRRIVRDSIGQAFKFTAGEGYEDVLGGSVENNYFLTVYEMINGEEVLYFSGEFHLTDCKFDIDAGYFEVVLRVNDQHGEFIDQEDTELDLITLGTPQSAVSFQIFASLQVYAAGSQAVGVMYDGTYFDRNVEAIKDVRATRDAPAIEAAQILVNDLNFSNPTEVFYIPYRDDYPHDISGQYYSMDSANLTSRNFRRFDGLYTWSLNDSGQRMAITNAAGVEVAVRTIRPGTDYFGPLVFIPTTDPVVTATISRINVFGRFNIPAGMEWPADTDPVVEGDQFAPERTTDRTARYSLNVIPSVAFSETDQGFGRFAEFVPRITDGRDIIQQGNGSAPYPNSGKFIVSPGEGFYPVGRDLWTNVSFWGFYDIGTSSLVETNATTRVVDSAFTLSDSVRTILGEISPATLFDGSADNSEFLFSDINPLTGEKPLVYILVPKSNILVASYDKPAGRAPIRMSDVSQMLRFFFQAEPFIEPDNTFRIETERWFGNGQTYDEGQPLIGVDLTTLRDEHTGRLWSYFTDSFEFDKEKLPERMVFGFMDESTDPFEGQDIVMLSNYVERGQKEERRVATFSTDLQMALNIPSAFSDAGFFLLACNRDEEGNLVVAKTEVPGFGASQNGALSWPYLHAVYYRDNLPAKRVLVNGEEIAARSTRPTKKQSVRTPVPPGLSPLLLAKTNIGTGIPESINENMASKVAVINIAHGTD